MWLSDKESACQCRRWGFSPWVGKIPWRRKWQPTPVFLPGESHGQRSLAGYSPWLCRVRQDWAIGCDQRVCSFRKGRRLFLPASQRIKCHLEKFKETWWGAREQDGSCFVSKVVTARVLGLTWVRASVPWMLRSAVETRGLTFQSRRNTRVFEFQKCVLLVLCIT